ncbi:PREDICTED: serine/threonine-protein kinase PINK1, mitochondrial [Nicrophorus vespilloides]|uniref:non-specific serine/threonine protein kinase n=1 Tax=Nicrophorus vespilloides TaxID=110193 RepID=A0ABM1NF20_NICVS|nr:PREDICTED: serine/threonine-protein kinase PINK1, mitochondrial [Nicrophorus vespilloides]
MSIRAFGTRLFRHGQTYVKLLCKRDINTKCNIAEKINVVQQSAPLQGASNSRQVIPRAFALRNVGLQVGLHARRILIDNVLNRVTNTLAAELRKKAARRIMYGDSGPFFALVGVSLASGTGILTKEEELEGVCWEIREAISKIKWKYQDIEIDENRFENDPITVKDLSFAKPIAKGANAVVYSAKIAEKQEERVEMVDGSFGLVEKRAKIDDSIDKYPLAVKMMFNYDIQSNAMAILRAMYKETIPARMYYSNIGISDWELDLSERKKHLPPHPNVVAMYSVFTDYVPELKGARGLYPAALPSRIYPDGEGRNMSLFLIMKRYNCSLQDFVSSSPPAMRTSILLLAQLLEGIAHLVAHGIAHRDLKSDNLLLDTSESHAPILVITDFGCCLADKSSSLSIAYANHEIDKGGNSALMAPEIINQSPGTFSVLNYAKSDLWAAGAIGYEIFGQVNPFYQKNLRNTDYKEEDLPDLPSDAPALLKALIKNILKRNPSKRLDPEVAANVCQLYLWAPSSWLKPGIFKLPTSAEILQWLLSLTTKVLCEGRLNGGGAHQTGRRTYTEYLLISSFLIRARLANIKAALSWIHSN